MKKGLEVITSLIIVIATCTGCCCCFTPGGGDISSRIIRDINAGPVVTLDRVVELDDAEQVEVTIQFGGGTLEIGSSGDDLGKGSLMSGEFLYNLDELEPEIDYTVTQERGSLRIRNLSQEIRLDRWTKEIRNEWKLVLTNEVPLEMVIDTGASQGELALGGLPITGMELTVGAADVKVSFDERNPQEMNALRVHSGAARLELANLGNANLEKLLFDGGIGSYIFDLRGEWQRSAQVEIKSGVSNITIRLPGDVGVRLCPGSLKEGDYGKLQNKDGCYVNELYKDAEIKIEIKLDVGLSDVNVK
ncbi:MAG: hypothetical protein JXA89_00560 [Anaerolineae bacterium]|nr:hypothetical protein [Anaerolineae bacterium]